MRIISLKFKYKQVHNENGFEVIELLKAMIVGVLCSFSGVDQESPDPPSSNEVICFG
jgi:hypothetical protein